MDDDDAGAELLAVDKKRLTPMPRYLFGLFVVLSWFGNIRFLCAVAISYVFGFPLPERYAVVVKAVED